MDRVDGKKIKVAIIDTGVGANASGFNNNISSLSYDAMTGTSPSRIYDTWDVLCWSYRCCTYKWNRYWGNSTFNVEIMPISLDLDGSVKYSQMVNAINQACGKMEQM